MPSMEPATELSSSPQSSARRASAAAPPDIDQRVILNGMTWKDFEMLLTIRGESSGVRMAYLHGSIELMSPSADHESIKKTIARLVEVYAD